MSITLPSRGFVFWPVGTGDSTTIVVDADTVLQVDVHHMKCSDDDDDPAVAVVDELVATLPQRDGRPYLAVFALTHADQDHCKGFADLLDRVDIGELWFSPRAFTDASDDDTSCDDAEVFHEEALRRVRATIAADGEVASGDRVRIVGWAEELADDDFEGFPEDRITAPGQVVTEVDGVDRADDLRIFVHAPFKDGVVGERNDASLALQVTLKDGAATGKALLFGDHCYPTLKAIFDRSEADDLAWNVLLAPHHCSKSAMYWADEGGEETLRQDLLDALEQAALSPAFVVSSSAPVPAKNAPGDNPPHAKAKARYTEVAPDGFLCTMEHPSESSPQPIVFEVDAEGFRHREPAARAERVGSALLKAAVDQARGGPQPPTDRIGFGRRRGR